MVKSGLTAALVGLVYGGLPGARHARQRFIQLSQAEVYNSRVEAVVSTDFIIGSTVLCISAESVLVNIWTILRKRESV